MHFDHSNTGARSPYYGVFLYSLAHRGTLWLLSAAQIRAWMMYLLWRSMAPSAPAWTYYTLMAALAVGTSLPWVASFAVPDVFAAVLIGCAALLLFYRESLARWERGASWSAAVGLGHLPFLARPAAAHPDGRWACHGLADEGALGLAKALRRVAGAGGVARGSPERGLWRGHQVEDRGRVPPAALPDGAGAR